MTIDVATGIARILKQEGVGWVSTFPVCRVNNALGREGVPMLMMRDDRYAVAVADPYRPVKGWKSAPDPGDVRAAVDQLLQARNPLIYAGEGVIYAGASEDLKALAELVNTPVITTLKAKGAFPENHPLFVGVRGDQVAHYLEKSDLILAIGSSLSPLRFSHAIPDAAKKTIIHCNVDELHINKIYPTAHAVIGDARLTLQALRKEVSDRASGAGRPAGNVAAEVKAARDAGLAKYREVMASDEKPINPYRVYGELMQVLDPQN